MAYDNGGGIMRVVQQGEVVSDTNTGDKLGARKLAMELLLINTIEKNLTNSFYQYTVDYAKELRQHITGDNIDELLRQFVRREDDAMFAQRKMLTQLINPAICHNILTPTNKVAKVNPVVKKVDFPSTGEKDGLENKNKIEEVNTAINNFYGGEGLDKYFEEKSVRLSAIDPNAFSIVTFDTYDEKVEKAKPYGMLVYSDEAIRYEYKDNQLQWLIVKKPIKYTVKNSNESIEKDGYVYHLYTNEFVIEYLQVDESKGGVKGELHLSVIDGTEVETRKIDEQRVFAVFIHEPKTGGIIQAKRIGYILDDKTKGQTCLSIIDPALPYLRKCIKSVSEMDLSVTLHVFLQKFLYRIKCQGEKGFKCSGGTLVGSNDRCRACNGTGWATQTTAQDTIEIGMPSDPAEMFDLQKLAHYQEIPTEIVEILERIIDKYENKAVKAVYCSSRFTVDSVAKTATENLIDMDSVYDALYPLGRHYSAMYIHHTKVIAGLLDFKNTIVEHQFPKDFKFKTLGMLLNEHQAAANTPSYTREQIVQDINAIIYQDRPDELTKIKVRNYFNPFAGKTELEIQTILSDNLCTIEDKTLWSLQSQIFNELEYEAHKEGVWFYDLALEKQIERVNAKVKQKAAAVSEQNNFRLQLSSPFSADTPDNEAA